MRYCNSAVQKTKRFNSRIVLTNKSNNGESLCWRKDFFTCSNLSLADIVKGQNGQGYSKVNQTLVDQPHWLE